MKSLKFRSVSRTLKNHWLSWKVAEICKNEKIVENPWISDQLLREKNIEFWNIIILTNYIRKWICILHVHHLLIYYSWNETGRLYLQIFLKIPNSIPNMSGEPLHNMWSCVFLFCNTQNYHRNLGISVLKYHWNIIEIFRGLSAGTLKMLVPLFNLVRGWAYYVWERLKNSKNIIAILYVEGLMAGILLRSWNGSMNHYCHNGRDGVPSHQPHDCLLKLSFRRRSKETSKLPVTGICLPKSPVTGEFPAQMARNAANASIWWRHHDVGTYDRSLSGFDFNLQRRLSTHTVIICMLAFIID